MEAKYENAPADVAVPPTVVTATALAPAACAGAVAVIDVALFTVKVVAVVPPKETAVAPVRFVPVIVTLVPPAMGPLDGLTDAIVGASKQMHVVLSDWCTGCDLCIPPCPVDCISMIDVTGSKTGWEAWSTEQADVSRKRYHDREERLYREQKDNDDRLAKKAAAKLVAINAEDPLSEEEKKEQERKRAIIAAAIARAQEKK